MDQEVAPLRSANQPQEPEPKGEGSVCADGHWWPLDWHSAKYRGAVISNRPREMMMASGFLAEHAKWIGFCVRCGDSVEWSTHRPPRKERYRRKRDKHGAPMPPERVPVPAVDQRAERAPSRSTPNALAPTTEPR